MKKSAKSTFIINQKDLYKHRVPYRPTKVHCSKKTEYNRNKEKENLRNIINDDLSDLENSIEEDSLY